MQNTIGNINLIIPNLRDKINNIIDSELANHRGMGLAQMTLQFPSRSALKKAGITEATDNLLATYDKNPQRFFNQLSQAALTIARVDGKFKHRKEKVKDHLFTQYRRTEEQDYLDIIHLSGVAIKKETDQLDTYINKNAEAIRHGFAQGIFKLLLLDTGNNEMVLTIYGCFTTVD